jgi:transcriptional regulator with XRE-family HTH domain
VAFSFWREHARESKDRGARLRDLRRKKGLSQWAVARAVGRTQGWLSAIELGYVIPSDEVALNIMSAIRELEPSFRITKVSVQRSVKAIG